MNGEASFLLSGFGTYSNEVLSRLHATGKYELAEFATYGYTNDPRDTGVKWKYYANAVRDGDNRYRQYKSDPLNQFGAWRFERVLLDFKPDIVWDIRDYWMLAYANDSPLRDYFHWVVMPTVDSAPQKPEWIETFMEADGVFGYSDWNLNVLKEESNNKINTIGTASPAVDLDVFCPSKDIKKHRENMNLEGDVFIIGTVMRNQVRKLYPDLFSAFKRFLDICYENGNTELAEKTYLYVHTSYPDVGWNIPRLLKEAGISNKVIFTYICRNCEKPSCSFFQDARTSCPHCNQAAAILPSVSQGLTREQLADIYKLFDVYVQYSVCEGMGMPQVEAAACGVPVMSVDYSAMEDVVRYVKGIPLKVQRMFREVDTHSYRALPDNEYCAQQFYKYLTKPDAERKEHRVKIRKATAVEYNWDKTAKIWERYFDSVVLTGLQGKWDAPLRKHEPLLKSVEHYTNSEFIEWLIGEVLNKPEKLHMYSIMSMLRDLNHGVTVNGKRLQQLKREDLFDHVIKQIKQFNECEQARCGLVELVEDDYLEYARMKEKLQNE